MRTFNVCKQTTTINQSSKQASDQTIKRSIKQSSIHVCRSIHKALIINRLPQSIWRAVAASVWQYIMLNNESISQSINQTLKQSNNLSFQQSNINYDVDSVGASKRRFESPKRWLNWVIDWWLIDCNWITHHHSHLFDQYFCTLYCKT